MNLESRKFIAVCDGKQADPIEIKRPKWEDMIKNYPNSSMSTVKLYAEIGGKTLSSLTTENAINDAGYGNSCCIRISRALNLSGITLSSDNSSYRDTVGGVIKGEDKKNYWIRVRELSKYLDDILGKPEFQKSIKRIPIIQEKDPIQKNKKLEKEIEEKKKSLTDDDWNRLHKMKGIILFSISGWGDAGGHITLWDGKNLIYVGNIPDYNNPDHPHYYFHMTKYYDGKGGKKDKIVQTYLIKLWELK